MEQVNKSNAYENDHGNPKMYQELYSYDELIAVMTYNGMYALRTIHVNVSQWNTNGKPVAFCTATTRRHFALWLERLNKLLDIPYPYELSYREIRGWYDYACKIGDFDEQGTSGEYVTNSGVVILFHRNGL